jgi:hypothetical protein
MGGFFLIGGAREERGERREERGEKGRWVRPRESGPRRER